MRIKNILITALILATASVAMVPMDAYAGDPPASAAGGKNLKLLEPFPWSGGVTEITPADTVNMGAFFKYLNCLPGGTCGIWKWAFGVGIGIAMLNATAGGLQIVLSNGDQGKVDAGKSRFLWSALGLLMLILAGSILHFINPAGFVP